MSKDALNDRLDQARKHLLEAPYGRFDAIPGVVPVHDLLQGKPRQLARHIAGRLGVSIEQVGVRALSSWLLRFKKRQAMQRSETMGGQGGESRDEGKEEGNAWRDFKPSEPRRQEPQEGDLLGFPNYD
jgi:hypothetical protein